jgi:2-hydroxychromene-2-carboxylate isomerase
MAAAINFYFDFTSPYGYLAAQEIDQLGARHGRAVEWHPMLLGVVFKTTGAAPLPQVPLKGPYSLHDFERSARFHGIEYRQPQPFPIATQATARAMLWLQQQYGKQHAVDFAKAAYRAYFVDGVQIGDAANVAQIAAGLGVGVDAGALTEALGGAQLKERLRTEVEQAIARGVFGSPFMIVDDESFWGFDRFDQLDAYLRDGKI